MTNPTTVTAEPGLPFITVVREFDAPAKAVFLAHTDPELFVRWMGPRTATLEVVEWDVTVGGRWRYQGQGGGGQAYGFRGVFHTVDPNSLIIQTFEFDDAPGIVGIESITFEEIEGRTRLTLRDVFPTVEVRDIAMATGMESGLAEGYERLDEIL